MLSLVLPGSEALIKECLSNRQTLYGFISQSMLLPGVYWDLIDKKLAGCSNAL